MMGTGERATAWERRPAEGVTPPVPSAEHNSTRSAPPAIAASKLARKSTQTSKRAMVHWHNRTIKQGRAGWSAEGFLPGHALDAPDCHGPGCYVVSGAVIRAVEHAVRRGGDSAERASARDTIQRLLQHSRAGFPDVIDPVTVNLASFRQAGVGK